MHATIRHLLARRGQRPPFDDRRRIALVLYGGIMTGMRGGGAMKALEELELADAFDDVYCYSAGLPNVAYLLTGEVLLGISIYYEELAGRQFINRWRFWRVLEIERFMDAVQRRKPIEVERLVRSHTNVHVRLYDLTKKEEVYVRLQDFSPHEIFSIIRAATSPPLLSSIPEVIRGHQYRDFFYVHGDGGEIARHALGTDATDILVIYNQREQRVRLPDDPRVFEIVPPTRPSLGPLETRPERLKAACLAMGRSVKELFGESGSIDLKTDHS